MKVQRRRTFDDRYLGFVDILGFRSLVKEMDSNPGLFDTVRDTLKTLERLAGECQEYRRRARRRHHSKIIEQGSVPLVPKSLLTQLQMTAFSDCYVISETSPAWHVLATVQTLGAKLLREGVFSRGAVVHGRAYHRGPVVFGPAVIEAYELSRIHQILDADARRRPRGALLSRYSRTAFPVRGAAAAGLFRLRRCAVDAVRSGTRLRSSRLRRLLRRGRHTNDARNIDIARRHVSNRAPQDRHVGRSRGVAGGLR